MATDNQTSELLDQIPDLVDGKVEGPEWSQAESIYARILQQGRDGIVAIIDRLNEVDDGRDYKARYTLHGIAAYVSRDGLNAQRRVLLDTFSRELRAGRPKPIKAFLIRQLQVVGDAGVTKTLGDFLVDETLGEPAAQALLSIGHASASQFHVALDKAEGQTRLTIVHALGSLNDDGSIEALKRAARSNDQDLRIAAVWALARTGNPSAADDVLVAAEREGWERIQGTKAAFLLAETLSEAGERTSATALYRQLHKSRRDSESYLRELITAKLH